MLSLQRAGGDDETSKLSLSPCQDGRTRICRTEVDFDEDVALPDGSAELVLAEGSVRPQLDTEGLSVSDSQRQRPSRKTGVVQWLAAPDGEGCDDDDPIPG
jgi:hypothetical protein